MALEVGGDQVLGADTRPLRLGPGPLEDQRQQLCQRLRLDEHRSFPSRCGNDHLELGADGQWPMACRTLLATLGQSRASVPAAQELRRSPGRAERGHLTASVLGSPGLRPVMTGFEGFAITAILL